MSEHTLGPWRAKESPHKRDFSYCIDAGPDVGSYFIAAVNNGAGPDDANARLIAAAPDLLAALEALYDPASGPCRTVQPGAWPVHDQARAAIAKAKGGGVWNSKTQPIGRTISAAQT